MATILEFAAPRPAAASAFSASEVEDLLHLGFPEDAAEEEGSGLFVCDFLQRRKVERLCALCGFRLPAALSYDDFEALWSQVIELQTHALFKRGNPELFEASESWREALWLEHVRAIARADVGEAARLARTRGLAGAA